jgi:hypothetical protein
MPRRSKDGRRAASPPRRLAAQLRLGPRSSALVADSSQSSIRGHCRAVSSRGTRRWRDRAPRAQSSFRDEGRRDWSPALEHPLVQHRPG